MQSSAHTLDQLGLHVGALAESKALDEAAIVRALRRFKAQYHPDRCLKRPHESDAAWKARKDRATETCANLDNVADAAREYLRMVRRAKGIVDPAEEPEEPEEPDPQDRPFRHDQTARPDNQPGRYRQEPPLNEWLGGHPPRQFYPQTPGGGRHEDRNHPYEFSQPRSQQFSSTGGTSGGHATFGQDSGYASSTGPGSYTSGSTYVPQHHQTFDYPPPGIPIFTFPQPGGSPSPQQPPYFTPQPAPFGPNFQCPPVFQQDMHGCADPNLIWPGMREGRPFTLDDPVPPPQFCPEHMSSHGGGYSDAGFGRPVPVVRLPRGFNLGDPAGYERVILRSARRPEGRVVRSSSRRRNNRNARNYDVVIETKRCSIM